MPFWALALVAATWYGTTAQAYTINPTPVTAADGANENAPLAKTWTIVGGDALKQLTVQSMGRVFVDYDASLSDNVAAQVIVSGDNKELLGAIEVVDTGASAIKIHFQNDAFEGQGHLLTHVIVANAHALRNVTMAWSSDLVLGDNVLVENDRAATVRLELVGSGDFYAGALDAELSLSSLGVTLAGSGDVQLLSKSLVVAETLDLNVTGSGDVAVVADAVQVDNLLTSLVAGEGNVFVHSSNLTAYNLSSTIAGAGDITYSHSGSCATQHVVIVGSGDVSSGSIVCVNTDVNLVGSGDVVVQTTENLTVATFFLGDVRYFGPTPRNITATSLFDYGATHKHAKAVVRPIKKNAFHEYDVLNVPERKPVYVVVKTSGDTKGDEPIVHYGLELETMDETIVLHFLSQQRLTTSAAETGEGSLWLSPLGFGGVGLIIVAVVAKHIGPRRRREYRGL